MTAAESDAWAEMYDAHGYVAREAAHAVDLLRPLVVDAVDLADLPAVLTEVLRRLERIYQVAAAERERWYRG